VDNPLEKLQVTTWYKALAAVSAPAFLITLLGRSGSLMSIFGGLFLVALGEWRFHTVIAFSLRQVVGGGIAKVKDVPRKMNVDGVLILGAGVLAVLFGIGRAYSLQSLWG